MSISLAELDIICSPIDQWDGPLTRERVYAPFKALWGSTLKLLARELEHLEAKNTRLLVACEDHEIRVDKTAPRANANVRHPGIVLAFESKHGPMRFSTDRYLHWQHNIRAIALGLEALRRVDRYGITKGAEQYKGWRQLPSGDGEPGIETKHDAAQVLADITSMPVSGIQGDPAIARDAYLAAVRASHPDRGGDPNVFHRVRKAAEVLGATERIVAP